MSLKHGLLGLLSYKDMTGYELDKLFKKSLNFFWQSTPSQIYRELNHMEKLEWLTSEIIFQTDKPNKKLYHITDSGRIELNSWLKQTDITNDLTIKNSFLMKTFFCGEQTKEESIDLLQKYIETYKNELIKLAETPSYIAQGIELNEDMKKKSIYWLATSQYGKAYYEMCIEWASQMIDMINNS